MNQIRNFAIAVAIAATSAGVLAAPRDASAQVCSAAVDTRPALCAVPADCPGTDLADLQPGDPVTITAQVTNQSTYFSNPPANPPAGELLPGSTVKVYYACTTSGCTTGLPDYLGFQSATLLGPAVGNATFADDGNGYSGTLTINNPIAFAEGDTAAAELVQVNLTAGSRPVPVPYGFQQFYSAAGTLTSGAKICSDDGTSCTTSADCTSPATCDLAGGAFEITSAGCFSGITGDGSGSRRSAAIRPRMPSGSRSRTRWEPSGARRWPPGRSRSTDVRGSGAGLERAAAVVSSA